MTGQCKCHEICHHFRNRPPSLLVFEPLDEPVHDLIVRGRGNAVLMLALPPVLLRRCRRRRRALAVINLAACPRAISPVRVALVLGFAVLDPVCEEGNKQTSS